MNIEKLSVQRYCCITLTHIKTKRREKAFIKIKSFDRVYHGRKSIFLYSHPVYQSLSIKFEFETSESVVTIFNYCKFSGR